MVTEFPLPVLTVTPDAVRDLDGREALSGLWTLFTKCKGSLQDGRRLENISWRLWYRELMLADREQRDSSTALSIPPSSLPSSLASSASSSSAFSAHANPSTLSDSNGDATIHSTNISMSSVYTRTTTSNTYRTPAQPHTRMRASPAAASLNPRKGVIIDTPRSVSHTTSPASSSLSSSLTATATGTVPSQRGMRSKQQNHTLNQHDAWIFSNSDNTSALDIPTASSMSNITGTTISKRSSAGINSMSPENMMSTTTDTTASTTTTRYTHAPTTSSTPSPSALHRQMYNPDAYTYTQSHPTMYTTASQHTHTHAQVQYQHPHQHIIHPPPPLSVQTSVPADADALSSALPSPRLTPLIPPHPAPSIPHELAFSAGDRARRSSFKGMRVGEIICDMLPPSLLPPVPAVAPVYGPELGRGESRGLSLSSMRRAMTTGSDAAAEVQGGARAEAQAGAGVGVEKAYVTRKEKEFFGEEARVRAGEGREAKEESSGERGAEGEAPRVPRLSSVGLPTPEAEVPPSESATPTSARAVLADTRAHTRGALDSPGPGAEAGSSSADVIASSARPTHVQTGAERVGVEGTHEGASVAASGGAGPAHAPLRTCAPTSTLTHARSLAHMDPRTGAQKNDRTGNSDKPSETRGYPVFDEAQGNGSSSDGQGRGQRGVRDAIPRGEVLPMVYHHLSQPASTSGASTPPIVNYTGAPGAEFSEPPPMLVVVNPTPNLTPHPTPPSTPVLYGSTQWLMPPGLNLNRGTRRSADVAKENIHDSLLRDHPTMDQYTAVVSLLPPSVIPPRIFPASRADEKRPQPQAPLRMFQQVLGETMTMSQHQGGLQQAQRLQDEQHEFPHADLTDADAGRDWVSAGMLPGFVPGFNAPGDMQDMVPLANPYAPGEEHAVLTPAMKLQQPLMTLGGVGAQNRLSMSSTASTSSNTTSLSGYSAASTSATSACGPEGAETAIGMLRASAEADGYAYAETACSDGASTLVAAAVPANHVVPDNDKTASDWREAGEGGAGAVNGVCDRDSGVHAHGFGQGGHAHDRRGTAEAYPDDALEEEEDEPLSPLPSATTFASASRSRSPRSASNRALLQLSPPQVVEEDSAAAQKSRKRHSAPPRSTSDSVQMRLALSLSPTSTLDPQAPVSPSTEEEKPVSTDMPALVRSQSTSSSRSRSAGGKRGSFSAANKRKGSMGPPPVPASALPAAGPSTGPHPSANNNSSNGAMTRRSSTGRGSSSSLGKSRSRSRDAGLNLALGMTLAAVANVAAAAPARGAKTSSKTKAKFSIRGGNKKVLAMRRNSSSAAVSARAKMKQKEIEMEEDEEEFDDEEEEEGEIKEKDGGCRDEADMALEAERAQQEKAAREKELMMLQLEQQVRDMEKEQERAFAQEQARRAAKAEEEKQRRRDLEREQRQLATMAALDAPPVADNVSETSSKRPIRFNIGSNSDDGLGSKSAGSGSDVSGALSGQSFVEAGAATAKGKEKEVYVNQPQAVQQQHLLPPPMPQMYDGRAQVQQQQKNLIPPAPHHPQQPSNQYMQVNQQMSKLQLRQLEGMEQMRQYRAGTGPVPQIPFQPPTQVLASASSAHSPEQEMTSTTITQTISSHDASNQYGAAIHSTAPKGTAPKDNGGHMIAAVVAGADKAILAKVEEALDLNEPLLPTGKKRVQVMTESEFETTDDDGGDWSSEEVAADDEEQQRLARLQREETEKRALSAIQEQHHRQLLQLQPTGHRHHVQPVRPTGVQRTHSSHYPVANNARGKQNMIRIQQQRAAAAAAAQAAKEAEEQRQRELFVKLPTSSFQDLAKARTNSVGNLTKLLNPDPEIFPINHPYRRGYSSGEIRRPGISALSSMQPMTPTVASRPAVPAPQLPPPAPAPVPAPVAAAVPTPAAAPPPSRVPNGSHASLHRRKSSDATSVRSVFSPPLRSAGLATSKSAVALPVATQIQVGSSNGPAAARVDHAYGMASHVHVNSAGTGSGGYRPKGPPKDMEMEESDSEEEGIIMPSSVAQEKLKALAQRRGIPSTRRASEDNIQEVPAAPPQPQPLAPVVDDDVVPQWAKVSPQPLPSRAQSQASSSRRVPGGLQITRAEPIPRPPPTAPIPVEYPYNLPLPIAPTTPKTTRRNMLANEMSESLRRNLLWQRHSSKPNLAALKRTASAGGNRNNGLAPLPPGVGGLPPIVQLHAKGTKPEGTSLMLGNPVVSKEEREAVRQRRETLSRNKSWANAHDDFHATGW